MDEAMRILHGRPMAKAQWKTCGVITNWDISYFATIGHFILPCYACTHWLV